MTQLLTDRRTAYNNGLAKVAVQCLNDALRFVSSFVLTDSFMIRNRQLLVGANRHLRQAPNRYRQPLNQIYKKLACNTKNWYLSFKDASHGKKHINTIRGLF